MTKKPPDRFAPVRAVISQLATLDHDELRDLADMLTADAAADARHIPPRHGIPPLDPDSGHTLILFGGWQYRDDPPRYTRAARPELQQAYDSADTLPPEARALIAQVARLLQNALAPIAERRRDMDGTPIATGNIQAKIIRRKVLDMDTGEIQIKPFGPYLYYRYLVSGGDADKRGRRLKNRYIGRQALAQMFDRTPAGSEERRDLERRIIAAFKAGTLDTLMMEMGLQPGEPDSAALGTAEKLPNPQHEAGDDNPPEPPNAAGVSPFLPDYQPVKNHRAPDSRFELTGVRRDVLAAYAAGLNYPADYADGIQKRKVARALAKAGLLAEITGRTDHRKHAWKLTEAGLKLIRADEDLQRRVSHWLRD